MVKLDSNNTALGKEYLWFIKIKIIMKRWLLFLVLYISIYILSQLEFLVLKQLGILISSSSFQASPFNIGRNHAKKLIIHFFPFSLLSSCWSCLGCRLVAKLRKMIHFRFQESRKNYMSGTINDFLKKTLLCVKN